jgi:hypothetical protein
LRPESTSPSPTACAGLRHNFGRGIRQILNEGEDSDPECSKLKNDRQINELQSFVAGLDCASANNGLKRAGAGQIDKGTVSRFAPDFVLNNGN